MATVTVMKLRSAWIDSAAALGGLFHFPLSGSGRCGRTPAPPASGCAGRCTPCVLGTPRLAAAPPLAPRRGNGSSVLGGQTFVSGVWPMESNVRSTSLQDVRVRVCHPRSLRLRAGRPRAYERTPSAPRERPGCRVVRCVGGCSGVGLGGVGQCVGQGVVGRRLVLDGCLSRVVGGGTLGRGSA